MNEEGRPARAPSTDNDLEPKRTTRVTAEMARRELARRRLQWVQRHPGREQALLDGTFYMSKVQLLAIVESEG